MIKKDIQAYAVENWAQYLESVTEVSKNKRTLKPLVTNSAPMYNFDGICLTLFSNRKMPATADGINITSRSIQFVEFKSGFKKKITRDTLDKDKARCKKTGEYCGYYWDLFFKNQEKETAELLASIRFKALESYLTLEKQFLPCCRDTEKPIAVSFLAVIDADPVTGMEDILSELSGRECTGDGTENILTSVRNSLRKLCGLHDARGEIYCYDKIDVLSCRDYANSLPRDNN